MRSERGSTFLSTLLAVAIMGLALTIFMAGVGSSNTGVGLVKQEVVAETYARTQLEMIHAASYQPNPTRVAYPALTATGSYTVSTGVRYWSHANERFESVMPAQDAELQEITVSVYGSKRSGQPLYTLTQYKGRRP